MSGWAVTITPFWKEGKATFPINRDVWDFSHACRWATQAKREGILAPGTKPHLHRLANPRED